MDLFWYPMGFDFCGYCHKSGFFTRPLDCHPYDNLFAFGLERLNLFALPDAKPYRIIFLHRDGRFVL